MGAKEKKRQAIAERDIVRRINSLTQYYLWPEGQTDRQTGHCRKIFRLTCQFSSAIFFRAWRPNRQADRLLRKDISSTTSILQRTILYGLKAKQTGRQARQAYYYWQDQPSCMSHNLVWQSSADLQKYPWRAWGQNGNWDWWKWKKKSPFLNTCSAYRF